MTTVDMEVKCWLNLRKHFACPSSIPHNLWPLFNRIFWGSSKKNPPCANSIHFLGLNCHFTIMLTVVLLVATAEVISPILHATKDFFNFSFQQCESHFCMLFHSCQVNRYIRNSSDHLCIVLSLLQLVQVLDLVCVLPFLKYQIYIYIYYTPTHTVCT